MKATTLIALAFLIDAQHTSAQTINITYDSYGNRITKSILGTYPTPVVIGDSAVCRGDSAHLFATGGGTYLWSTGVTQSTLAVLVDTTRTYTVTAYSPLGCAATVGRQIRAKPVLVTGPLVGDTTAHVGEALVYAVPDHAGSFYEWSLRNGICGYIDTGYSHAAISIRWTQPGIDTLEVFERLSNGCKSPATQLRVSVQPATGIASVSATAAILVYPNPTRAGAGIRIELPDVRDVVVTVIDPLGRKVGSISGFGQASYDLKIDKALLSASGIYTLLIACGDYVAAYKLTAIH